MTVASGIIQKHMSIARQVTKTARVRDLAHLLEEMYGSSEDPHNIVIGPLLEKPTKNAMQLSYLFAISLDIFTFIILALLLNS